MVDDTQKKEPIQKKAAKAGSNLQADVYDVNGKVVETIELPARIFNAEVSDALMTQYVYVYQTNMRRGNASAKTRSEVIGSTRKIYRQKGTGRARHGANKAPIFVGGGVAHGPSGKVFSLSMSKKQKEKALFSAFTTKNKQKGIFFVKGLLDMKPKTKEAGLVFKKFDTLKNKSMLLAFPKEKSANLVMATRNLTNVTLKDILSINAYDLLRARNVCFAVEALPVLKTQHEQ